MRMIHLVTGAMLVEMIVGLASAAKADQLWWPQFRGPNATGVAEDGDYPVDFGPENKLLWKTALPVGHSSPCVWDDRVYLTGFDSQNETLETCCLDRASGQILWRRVAASESIEAVNKISSPASPTPATDGHRVYVYFGSCGLLCYDFDGNEIWTMRLPIPKTKHGSSTSPIVANGLVILNQDQQGRWFQDEQNKWQRESHSYIMAVDCATGDVVWKQQRPTMMATYSVPVLRDHNGAREILVQGRNRLVAYSLTDGTRRWWCDQLPPTASSTPVIGNGYLYLAAQDSFGEPENVIALPEFDQFLKAHDQDGDGTISKAEIPSDFAIISRGREDRAGNLGLLRLFPDRDEDGAINQQEWDQLAKRLQDWKPRFRQGALAVRLGSSGDVTQSHIAWRVTKGVPEVPSPLFYQDRVYYVKNGGIVFCRDARDGSVAFRGRLGPASHFYSSPVAGGGNIYSASESGVVVVFETGDSLRVLARNDLGERIMATPALVDGKLYVRTEHHLWAFGG